MLPPLYYQCSSRDTEQLLVLSSGRAVHCLPQPTNKRHKWTSIPVSHSGAALGAETQTYQTDLCAPSDSPFSTDAMRLNNEIKGKPHNQF